MMIKPQRLKSGDRVAIVSLSWGGLGDSRYIHKYHIAKKRLESEFGLQVVPMPHALMGSEYIYHHPEARAEDLMQAFSDSSIKAIFSAIGGDDTIRILPYINLDVITKNPKIFMGYSDTTVNHFMMYQAGIVSFYGPSVMCEFGEYGEMFPYTKAAVQQFLFGETLNYELKPSYCFTDEYIPWDEKNQYLQKQLKPDPRGYEVLQGSKAVEGHFLGGCLDVFMMVNGTKIWPSLDQWRDAILFLETSEDTPTPDFVRWQLRNLAASGVLQVIKGIIVGRPYHGIYYEEYKTAILDVVAKETGLTELPIFYNVNVGHSFPNAIIPYGIKARLNPETKSITILENATLDSF